MHQIWFVFMMLQKFMTFILFCVIFFLQNAYILEEICNEPDDEGSNREENIPWPLQTLLVFLLAWQFTFNVSDAAVIALLAFTCKFLKLLAEKYTGIDVLERVCRIFPATILAAQRLIGLTGNNTFIEYITCPLCHSIYKIEEGCIKENGQQISNTCKHVAFPHHPMQSQREVCQGILMKQVGRNGSENKSFLPHKTFPYQSLLSALEILINRKGFLDCCEQWRSRSFTSNFQFMGDVYDGRVWQEFLECDGLDFLRAKHNLCFTINVDWFQPFTHTRKYAHVLKLMYDVEICPNVLYKKKTIQYTVCNKEG